MTDPSVAANTLLETRGEPGAGTSPQTDFGPWGGSIAFDNDASTTWYFDSDPSSTGDIPSGEADFYSVAIHELGHVLGYSAGDANNSWASKIVLGNFTGPASVLEYGGPVPLSGDSSHWAEGTTSFVPGTAIGQEAAMDPSLLLGSRKFFTDLDFAGLSDIGWEVSAVPEPAEIAVITGIGLLGFAGWRRRRTLQP